ncbi:MULTISPECIES: beta-galactosidase [unclassified Cryobacterium]|uniref:beta-galactosidase n=1 Tax=unclassified Cryobacterium TaxID=2649013 RepID=UPI001068DEAF|nr:MULTISPECIES: beta-galactosidase [unclassified Cryobacterium]TFB99243.1 beta-galactosidase [Cryobacterium sp. MDB2-A-1]TFC02137.1 beta-galactosidase [Cryobacterium sp. MDB2-33-2]TFC15862.1 beta-galactosidase [Cryobacterium sp. MDB2-A-2]TFC16099.1 beta-galactosidase [Cryobacterium sp. MDB2-10]
MNARAAVQNEAASAVPFAHDGIAYGCDYNPEQWGPETWAEDMRLMRAAGVDLVAINIFGWSHIEPRPGEYDFANLDTIIELLHANGIRVNLGTGTSSPPPWLTTLHPEILPETEDGSIRYPGGRQAWCPSSPVFREHALALVEKVAERYGRHPAIALWHVSNELGCHNALCYDEDSTLAFRRWLQARYGTIAALNAAWGTSFWSQHYGDWSEILTPRLTLSSRNPGQVLDFHRFSSDELLDYYRSERDVIRRHSAVPVTTNFMVTAHIRNLDYWQWAPEVDVVANDHYLDHRLGDPVTELSFAADLTRGLAGGAPWLLMEQATGAVNWQPHNLAKAPGELTRNSLTHVARGADAVCFFQWRASLQGSEKFHSALVPHAGTDTELWREVVDLGAILDRLGDIAGTRVIADAAIVFSWEAWWAGDGESRPSQSVEYLGQMHAAYTALHRLGITVDVIAPDADLSGYRLVVVPTLYLVTDADAAGLADYVANGGHALVTFFSGIVDEDDRVRPGGYPGAFREMLGIRVEEFSPLLPGRTLSLDSGAAAGLWTERLRLDGATAVASYRDGPLPGVPAITRNGFGRGTAWYLATALEPDALRWVMRTVAQAARVTALGPESDGTIEVVRRADATHSYLFVINHGHAEIEIAASGHELVTDAAVDRIVRVPAGAVRVIREDTAA